jgi:hypothetical protein
MVREEPIMPGRRTISCLLALTTSAAALTAASAWADDISCPYPDDSFIVGWTLRPPETHGRTTDQLAISPGDASFDIAHAPVCTTPTTLTIVRPDGTGEHTMTMDRYIDGVDIGIWEVGAETVDYPTGTGAWRITKVSNAGATVALNHPVDYRVRRASTVSLHVSPATLPTRPRASGVVQYWTYQGVQAPSPGRTVVIRTPDTTVNGRDWFPGKALATTTTDSTGRYSVTLPIGSTQYVAADVPGTTTLGYVFTPSEAPILAAVYHPTYLTGRAAPTNTTVARPGTKMSTYGHLSVVYNSGKTGPFPKQQVVVQIRPRSNPAAGYHTVATATTTSTGYYYANWNIPYDADVRVAYLTPYQYIRSSFRYLALVDVH